MPGWGTSRGAGRRGCPPLGPGSPVGLAPAYADADSIVRLHDVVRVEGDELAVSEAATIVAFGHDWTATAAPDGRALVSDSGGDLLELRSRLHVSTDTATVRSRLPQAAAIYTRISLDPSGERLGVQRQEEDCRAEATRRGWRIAEVYEDDDRSAYNPRRGRPEYERLLTDIRQGVRDGVMIWRLDRLHRQPRELEEFIVVCDKHDVALATVTGDVDLATSQGRLLARAWAPSRHTSQRFVASA